MKFEWIKKGLIFDPTDRFEWMKSHAQVPTPLIIDDILRVYFTTRPNPILSQYVSNIGYVEFDLNNNLKMTRITDKPIIEIGKTGSFDEFGMMPGSIIKKDDAYYLYYTGWSREQSVPYTTSIGVAKSLDNGKTFQRLSKGPILSKNFHDPYLVNGPWIILKDGILNMWYSSCHSWISNENKIDPIYKIKHAFSIDGINWITSSKFCIEERIPNEAQNAPCIIEIKGKYYMFFCYRSGANFRNSTNGYRLSYAISDDLENWDRKEDLIFENFEQHINDWDWEMQAYPRVFPYNNKLYLLYNGNNFGKQGFGLAYLNIND